MFLNDRLPLIHFFRTVESQKVFVKDIFEDCQAPSSPGCNMVSGRSWPDVLFFVRCQSYFSFKEVYFVILFPVPGVHIKRSSYCCNGKSTAVNDKWLCRIFCNPEKSFPVQFYGPFVLVIIPSECDTAIGIKNGYRAVRQLNAFSFTNAAIVRNFDRLWLRHGN